MRYHYTDTYLLEYLAEDIFSGKQVLEVGCGQGIDASEILKYCASYVGVDLSGRSLEIAWSELRKLEPAGPPSLLSGQDAERLAFKDNAFDVVFSIGVLHHTANFEDALGQIHRVLRKEGILILMLYRSYTPLWLAIRLVRGIFRLPLLGPKVREMFLDSLRGNITAETSALSGTALLELIGCPIINTYSVRDLGRYFSDRFFILDTQSFRTGFDQLVRFLPEKLRKHWPQRIIGEVEEKTRGWLGFYLVVVAEKQ